MGHTTSGVVSAAAGATAVASLERVDSALDRAHARTDSLVLLSPGPVDHRRLPHLRGEGLAKLIMSGSGDRQKADAAALMGASIGWTVSVVMPTDAAGTAIIGGPLGAHVADRIGSFLREQEILVSSTSRA